MYIRNIAPKTVFLKYVLRAKVSSSVEVREKATGWAIAGPNRQTTNSPAALGWIQGRPAANMTPSMDARVKVVAHNSDCFIW